MPLTLAELQAKRDEILRDIEIARLRFADGREKQFVDDKAAALALIDEEIAAYETPVLRRTYVRTRKGW